MPELSNDPRFRTNKDRTEHRKILVDLLQTVFLTKTRAELDAMFEVRLRVKGWADKPFPILQATLSLPLSLLSLHPISLDTTTIYHPRQWAVYLVAPSAM